MVYTGTIDTIILRILPVLLLLLLVVLILLWAYCILSYLVLSLFSSVFTMGMPTCSPIQSHTGILSIHNATA
jgi:hypothetical protein